MSIRLGQRRFLNFIFIHHCAPSNAYYFYQLDNNNNSERSKQATQMHKFRKANNKNILKAFLCQSISNRMQRIQL